MKKFCAILFSFVLVLMLALPVAAEDAAGESDSLFDTAPALTAPAGYVVNLDTNIVVYEKNSETQLSAASLTKMMTTLLLLENYQDQLDSISLTAPSYIYDLIWEQSTNASTADIRRGETQSLRNLLYAMLLPSGNEAAYIVADYMGGGSIDNFVAMMNDEAKAVGCTGTTFVDPCGLNPNNITTARDAYLILRALTAYDVFATVIATPSYDMGTNDRYTTPGTYIIQNTDKLVTNSSYHRDYTRGGKTGSLGEWQNFAGWHSQNGESYISVLLNVPYDADPEGKRPALAETGTIMDWVFDTYTIAPALDTTQPITEVRVADDPGRGHRHCRFNCGQRCLAQSGFVHAFAREPFFFKHIFQSRHCADDLRRWLLWNIYCRPRPARLTQDTLSRIYRRVYPCWM